MKKQPRKAQLKTIFEYLQTHVATASMVAEATGVPHKNLCRYKRDLEQAGQLAEVKKDVCQSTGFKAWYITTDKSKFPQPAQLQISFTQP